VETSGNTDPGYISAEEFNNNRNNQEWVNKNFVKINKSMPKW
jgi:hypothetical protein